MDRGKKMLVIVLLLTLIIASGIFCVKRLNIGRAKPPQWVLDQPGVRIDAETLDLITKSCGEWEDLGCKNGKYKNPNTSKYTMVGTILCAHCGELVPDIQMPPMLKGDKMDPEAAREREAAFMQTIAEHKCPFCGKSPF